MSHRNRTFRTVTDGISRLAICARRQRPNPSYWAEICLGLYLIVLMEFSLPSLISGLGPWSKILAITTVQISVLMIAVRFSKYWSRNVLLRNRGWPPLVSFEHFREFRDETWKKLPPYDEACAIPLNGLLVSDLSPEKQNALSTDAKRLRGILELLERHDR